MTVKVHSGLCMKYSRWDIYISYGSHKSLTYGEYDQGPVVSSFLVLLSSLSQMG